MTKELATLTYPAEFREIFLEDADGLTAGAPGALGLITGKARTATLRLVRSGDGEILTAINSRTTRLSFDKLSGEDVVARLVDVRNVEGLLQALLTGEPRKALRRLVSDADRAVRLALNLLERFVIPGHHLNGVAIRAYSGRVTRRPACRGSRCWSSPCTPSTLN